MKNRNRSGSAFWLLLVLALAIGFLLAAPQASLLGHKKAKTDSSGQILPWNEENRLVSRNKTVAAPTAKQASLENPLIYKAEPKEADKDRGEIALSIYPGGRLEGNWSGDFRQGDRGGGEVIFSVLSGGFEGNIDPTKVFCADKKTDPTKLFFIAHGSFVLLGDNRKTNDAPQKRGEIFVTGWVDPNYAVSGKITLTSDRKSYKGYSWQCDKPKSLDSFYK